MTSNLHDNNNYTDRFTSLSDTQIETIRSTYKVIDVPYLDPIKVKYTMFADKYFQNNPGKEAIIINMLNFYEKAKMIWDNTPQDFSMFNRNNNEHEVIIEEAEKMAKRYCLLIGIKTFM